MFTSGAAHDDPQDGLGELDGLGDEVHLVVPPYSPYLRTVRLMAADAAARAGLDFERAEDFRVAVDELCHALIAATDHVMSLSFARTHDGVVARGMARGRDGSHAIMSEVSATIVGSLSDYYELGHQERELTFTVGRRAGTVHR
jgi:hypothetical protein